MTSIQDRLDDLDAMLAIAKQRDFQDWDADLIALLTNARQRWFRQFHDEQSAARSMPACRCGKPANVVYRVNTEHPVPRCWDCAPRYTDAVAIGLLDDRERCEAADVRTTGDGSAA